VTPSLPQAARIVGLTESTLRRDFFGTVDLPRLEGSWRVIDRHDAVSSRGGSRTR
jgi:hypothetical protein